MDDFPDLGDDLPIRVSDDATPQWLQASCIPQGTRPSALAFVNTDLNYCYYDSFSGTWFPYNPRFDWYGSEMLHPQDQGLSVFNTSTALTNGMTAVALEASHPESGFIDTGVNIAQPVREFSSTFPTVPIRLQSPSQPGSKTCIIHHCQFQYISRVEYKTHMKAAHQDAFTCDECVYVGKSQYELGLHASDTGHASFICKHDGCEKKFSRLDTYQRHQRTHREDAKRFPCKYCKKYRGKNGFKRKDHLTQHLRNYHHIGEGEQVGHMDARKWCPKKDCTESMPDSLKDDWRSRQGVFPSSKEWVKHVRTVHDESEYPCPKPGCDRVNGKGYFREADLRAHLRKVHGTDGSFDWSTHHRF